AGRLHRRLAGGGSRRSTLRAQARVSIRDRPDHPLVGLLMSREAIDAARNEPDAPQPIHRALKGRSVADDVIALWTSRDPSHVENRSTRIVLTLMPDMSRKLLLDKVRHEQIIGVVREHTVESAK